MKKKINVNSHSLIHSLSRSLALSLAHSLTQALCLHSSGQLFAPTRKASRYSTNTYLICDSTLQIDAVQLRSVPRGGGGTPL